LTDGADTTPPRDDHADIALTVIAPCFNEQDNVHPLAERTLAIFDALDIAAELILVDDGSADATWETITAAHDTDHRVRGVRHEHNRGMVPAWHTGLAAAGGDLVCLIDADLQNRPEDIARLYDRFRHGDCDLVQAVRHSVEGVCRMYLFSRGLNALLNLAFGGRLRDNKSGFVLCRRHILSQILQHRFRYRFFQAFLGASALSRGLNIAQVDTAFDARARGQSFLSDFPVITSLQVIAELLKYRLECWLYRRLMRQCMLRSAVQPAGLGPLSSEQG
jgi:glycosyltransferase involved in cell wall biosynthesis